MRLKAVYFLIIILFSSSLSSQENLLEQNLQVMDSLIIEGSLDKAIPMALEMNEDHPDNLRILNGLIFSYMALGMTEDAKHWLNKETRLKGDTYRSQYHAYLALMEGNYQRAKSELDILSAAANPDNPIYWYKAAPVALHLGDYQAAINFSEKFMALVPERKNLTALYAFSLIQKGKDSKAKEILAKHKLEMQENLAAEKNIWDAHMNLAKIAAVESDAETAIFHIDKYMDGYMPEFIHLLIIDEPAYTIWDNIRDAEIFKNFFEAKIHRIEEVKSQLELIE